MFFIMSIVNMVIFSKIKTWQMSILQMKQDGNLVA